MGAEEAARALDEVRRWSERQRQDTNLALLGSAPLFDIELASACNVVCTFCPRDEMVRGSALMSERTFAALLAFLPTDAVAMLGGLGDALLHPRLAEWVGRLVARGVSTCLITNGVRLTPARQDALIAAGIAEIQISVHGVSEATVRGVMPMGANPALVRSHVERLAARGGPRLRINFVETADNGHERPLVASWATELGARFFHRRQHTRGGTIGVARADPGCDGCGIFGSVTFITADGDITPCVNDVTAEGRFGNVRETDWPSVLTWKRQVIERSRWFDACVRCDDDYRWVLLKNRGLAGG